MSVPELSTLRLAGMAAKSWLDSTVSKAHFGFGSGLAADATFVVMPRLQVLHLCKIWMPPDWRKEEELGPCIGIKLTAFVRKLSTL